MSAPSPSAAPSSGRRSPASLAAVLVGAALVGAAYAAAALAWRAGYAAHLGVPLWHPGGSALVAVRAALVVGVGALVVLVVYGRRREALVVALALVACAPAWGGPVYSPAAGIRWTVQVARSAGLDSAPGALAVQAGAAGGLLALVLLGVLTSPPPKAPSHAHGTATWGEGLPLVEAERGLVLGRGGERVPAVGHAVERARRRRRAAARRSPGVLLRHNGPGHVLTVAPTRAGKGVGAVIPNLLDHPGPVVVTDPKGENLLLTARYRADVLGHNVVALDPFELAPDALFDRGPVEDGRGSVRRGGLNPLDMTGPRSPDATGDAALLAEMLVVGDESGGDNRFFADEAKALLAGLILYVGTRDDGEDRSLLAVRDLLTLDGGGLQTLITDMKNDDDALVKRAGNRLDQKHGKELSAVISTAQSHTHFLDSPRMATVLRGSTFDPAALRPGHGSSGDGRPLSVYLLLPPDRLDAFSRWLRLTVATTITALAKLGPLQGGAPPPERRALFLLDEFAQLGPMPPVRRAFSLMAGYGVQVWPFLQDLGQLRRLYPKDWESFVANSDAIQAFGTTDQFTAEYLSKMAGTATVFHFSQSAGRSRGKHTSRSAGAGTSETSRPVITPDELRRLGEEDQVLLVRGEDPVLARRIAYYADPTFDGRLKKAEAARKAEAERKEKRAAERRERAAEPAPAAPA
ncbi:type IV secretory system conjugative DNA transfer family protein [Rubrivirga sp. S365]|uniref:type IV secretory system conjugative DNA transfer family protein n=1 Tax=Rubrivirga sp. S365 TaxID=3076080 RepID=UPI0028C63096|nr:type IV secretory system conjugative DNA transfer family protein [Rubrivirga sp. S365]MDT7858196.1 type IV secretory system conjugative DNA transfer family protein [Rubrivirga sp. S365]